MTVETAPRLITLPEKRDPRGALSFAQAPDGLPFPVRRLFTLYDLPVDGHRGGHAHRACHQLLFCMSGILELEVLSRAGRQDFTLESPDRALYLPPLCWVDIRVKATGSVCAVLASHDYDAGDYLADRDEFQRLIDDPGRAAQ